MTEAPPEPASAEPGHHALLGLHALADSLGGVDPGMLPGFRPSSPGSDLRTVAEAPEDEIPVSARVNLLHDLARAGFPHYESTQGDYLQLAQSVAALRGVDAEQLLDDVKLAATERTPFAQTSTGQALAHRDVAFVGQDLCQTRSVQVGELRATWVFSEFETDASFADVVGWVDPRNWPKRGPMLFKGMSLVGADDPTEIAGLGSEHWHGVFLEQVQLVRRLNTLLHCDFWRDGDRSAGMTYDLALSLDGEIDVDRGFLSVNDLGPVRRVKALKVVGFTTDIWDDVARMVCPLWTDWVRGAVEGGSSSRPHPPSHTPGKPSHTPDEAQTPPPSSPTADTMQAWFDFFGDAARAYVDIMTDVTSRATSGGYSSSDLLADGTRYWSQLAKDWAKAWTFGLEMLDDVSSQGLDAGFAPPGVPRARAQGMASAMASAVRAAAPTSAASSSTSSSANEGTTIPVIGLGPNDQPRCTPLVSIEAGGATIPASDLVATVRAVDASTYGVHVECTNAGVAPGLYVGAITTPEGNELSPAQLYISRASGAS